MVRAFAHGAMGRRIDSSWGGGGPIELFLVPASADGKVMLILVLRHIHNTKSHYHYTYFSFQPVLHDWCNKGRGMCYPDCGMVAYKRALAANQKKSGPFSGGSGFPLLLSE